MDTPTACVAHKACLIGCRTVILQLLSYDNTVCLKKHPRHF